MDPLTLALIGGGLGVGRMVQDNVAQSNEAKRRAAEEQFSPWTHQTPSTQVGPGGGMGSILQGAAAGAQFGQNIKTWDDIQNVAKTSPYKATEMEIMAKNPMLGGPVAMQSGMGAGPLAYNPYAMYGI